MKKTQGNSDLLDLLDFASSAIYLQFQESDSTYVLLMNVINEK